MFDLLRYASVIYDTMCIVYYCFKITEKNLDGNVVVILGPNTERARRITNQLVRNRRKVRTLRISWTEVENVLIAKALAGEIKDGYIQHNLGIGHQVSPALRLRLVTSLRQELNSVARKPWFFVDGQFIAPSDRMENIREQYRQFALNPKTQNRIPPGKYIPSNVDISLILYSGHTRTPLLTNDKEIYNFAPELSARGFCEMIKPFLQVRFS